MAEELKRIMITGFRHTVLDPDELPPDNYDQFKVLAINNVNDKVACQYFIYADKELQEVLGLWFDAWMSSAEMVGTLELEVEHAKNLQVQRGLQLRRTIDELKETVKVQKATIDNHVKWLHYYSTGNWVSRIFKSIFTARGWKS